MNTIIEIVHESKLSSHPVNGEIYPTEDISDIKASIRDGELLEPLIVDSEYRVISGNRRLKALRELGREDIPVIRNAELQQDDIGYHIIGHNLQRIKTQKVRANEVGYLDCHWRKPSGMRTDLGGFPDEQKGSTRKRIAETLNLSETHVQQLMYLTEHDDSYIDRIDRGEFSLSGAYKELKGKQEAQTESEPSSISDNTSESSTSDDLNKGSGSARQEVASQSSTSDDLNKGSDTLEQVETSKTPKANDDDSDSVEFPSSLDGHKIKRCDDCRVLTLHKIEKPEIENSQDEEINNRVNNLKL